MNPRLQAKLTSSIHKLQGLVGELVQIAGTNLTVIGSDEILTQEETAQGLRDTGVQMRISIARADLPARPARGAAVQARGRTWHIQTVDPTQTTWEVILQTQNK